MIAILAIGVLGVVPATAVPASPGPGYQDFQYNAGPETATGGDAVTGARNQSKLWFHDGKWWGVLFDKTNAANPAYRIQSLNMATQTWTTGATATQADKRNKSHADVLQLADGTLWMASSHKSGSNAPPNGDLQVFKFTYNTTSKTYTIVSGFPKTVAGAVSEKGTESATIARAPNGLLWVAYTQDDATPATTAKVKVISSTTAAGTAWNAPVEIPGGTSPITVNDVAAITNVNGGVGVLWSNQSSTDHAFYFSVHPDGGAWSAREIAYNPPLGADGHMNVKTNTNGDVIAAVKTSQTGASPLIGVLRRTAGGTWEGIHTVANSSGSPDPTRPIIVLDPVNNEANVFMTSQVDGGFITRRTAPLDTLDFGTPSSGAAFIQSSADPLINDPTSSKQPASAASGIIVLASDRTDEVGGPSIRRYLHGCAGSVCPATPVTDFTGTPLSGEAPLAVQFTDTTTGNPTAWAWNFGDGLTSTEQNPLHTFNPGTYTVSLFVSNALGGDEEVKVGYVTVSATTAATYTAITPVRVMDSRDGTGGISGKFVNGTPRSFQVTGGAIPSTAVAITGNLTVTGQSKPGFLFLGPTASGTPTSSTLNFPVADTRANAVTVGLSATGGLAAVYKSSTAGATTNVFLDVTGYFVKDNLGSKYTAVAPVRVMDSRDGTGGISGKFVNGTPRTFAVAGQLGIPSSASAITGNLTVTGQTKAGFAFLGPTATGSPTSSTLNFPVGDTRANAVTVALNAGNLSAVYKSSTPGARTNLFLDVTGYFDATGSRYIALSPIRVMDTRDGTGGLSGKFVNGTPRSFDVAQTGATVPASAIAITGNLTVTTQSKAGFVFLGPTATGSPTSSTLNFPVGDTRANAVTVGLNGTGGLGAVYKSSTAGATTNLFLDVTGYFEP
jgi:PKD repeat protein